MTAVLMEELQTSMFLYAPDTLAALAEMGPAAQQTVPIILSRLEKPQTGPFGVYDSTVLLNTLEQIDRPAAESIRRKQEASHQSELGRQLIAEMAARSNGITSRLVKGEAALLTNRQ